MMCLSGQSNSCRPVFLSAGLLSAVLLLSLLLSLSFNARAQSLSCPPAHQISERFDDGSGWDMCWESRQRENIVLSEISYTPAGGSAMSVLAELRLAQLHVAYDLPTMTSPSLVSVMDIARHWYRRIAPVVN